MPRLHLLKKIWQAIKYAHQALRALDVSAINLEEIDISKKVVVVRSRGARAVLKLSIAEAIADPSIIANLLPVQACWLGYYAGLLYDPAEIQKQKQYLKNAEGVFSLKCAAGQYRVVSQDRKGEITYMKSNDTDVITEYPINIVQDEVTISKFDASQACYIGILAGIYVTKYGNNAQTIQKKPPILHVIK
ncbi:MAG: hypothetical protein A3F13_09865 [Gammaproteobacteria bacterium RIFCSPHIGHO2_12_FULL_40_19]|nr:MAG: hypothetical protein A3F13_09865 [Gammaproteobacteria bacterium RIFCSPHIGHO2_12_FULL_40_19]